MQSRLAGDRGNDQVNTYRAQMAALKDMRSAFNDTMQAQGAFTVSSQRVTSATERFNDAIRKNKVGLSDLKRNFGIIKQAQKEQIALQNAMGSTWSSGTPGKMNVDLFIPKGVDKSLNGIRQQLGYANQVVSSIATQTINWGKNTQWAGRQIMVGITVPMAIAAAGMAKLTYDTDKQLTRLAKVYDLQTEAAVSGANTQEGAERELSMLRESSLNNAIMLANKYGQSVNDTLTLQANLAATGLSGSSLTKMTEEVSRIAALGELTTQQSTDMAVALKTAFRLTDEGVVHFNDFANAVENATSLSINDIAEATPRAASALSGLGVTAEQMTVLLVSMKEAGVNAAEGANALKSATTRILRPTPQAKNIFSQYGVDLQALVDSTQGNLFKTLKKLAPAMQKMTAYQKQQAVAALFGTYQFNRLNAALANLNDESTQAGKAMDIMGKSQEELAAISAGELEKAANSASGKFKRYVEGIKGELAKMGQSILAALNPVLNGINKMFSLFNSLGDNQKTIVLITAALLGAVGPVMMLIGVFGNLIGSFLKSTTAISNLFLRFKMMTAEERAAAIAAKQASNVFDTQAMSAERLRNSINQLNAAMADNIRNQGGMTAAARANGALVGSVKEGKLVRNPNGIVVHARETKDANGNTVLAPTGRKASAERSRQFSEMERSSSRIEQNTAKTSAHWGRIAGAAGALSIAALAVGSMSTGSADVANSAFAIAGALTVASLIPWTAIAGKAKVAFTAVKTAAMATAVAINASAGSLGKISATAKGIGRSFLGIGAALGPVGIAAVAITAAAASAYVIYQWSQKTRKEWDAIANSGGTLSEIVGASGTVQNIDPLTGEKVASKDDIRIENVEKLKEANEDLYKSLQKVSDVDLQNIALAEGFKVKFRGGTEEQIRDAIELVFAAAGKTPVQINEIMLSISKINWENPEAVQESINKLYEDSLNEVQKKNRSTSFWNIFIDDNELTQGAAGAARSLGTTFSDQLKATLDDNQRGILLQGFNNTLEADTKDTMTRVNNIITSEGGKAFTNGAALLSQLQKEMKKSGASATELNDARYIRASDTAMRLKLSKQEIQTLLEQQAVEKEVALAIADSNKWKGKERDTSTSLEAVAKKLGVTMGGTAGANDKLTDSTGAAVDGMEAETAAATELADTLRKDIVNAMQAASSGTMNNIYAKADDMLQERQSSIIDSIKAEGEGKIDALEARAEKVNDKFEARKDALQEETDRLNEELKTTQKRESKAFDKQWDDMMKNHDKSWDNRVKVEEDAYDARIKAIEDEISAEEKADEVRQRLFDAEISRIQRMSQMFNSNIDFNAALNSGNLDEAAKISSSATATQSQWSLDDQRANGSTALDQRKEAANNQIDQLKNQKEASLAALKAQQEAEKEVLDLRKEQEQELLDARQDAAQKAFEADRDRLAKSLDAEKDAYNKGVSANKERLQKRTQANQDAANAEFKANKEKLDLELMQLKAFIPKDEVERKAHIKRIQAAYETYGSGLKLSGAEWSKYIGDSLVANVNTAKISMQEKSKWEQLGNAIKDGMASSFNVNGDQLMQWLTTGIYPQKTGTYGGGKATAGKTGQTARHTGGSVGWSSKDRTGVPRSASLYPSEYTTILKKREFVVNEKASRKHGPLLNAINSGSYHEGGEVGVARHTGGSVGSVATGMMASVAKAIVMSIGQSLTTELAQSAYGGIFGIANAGKYGQSNLSDEQLGNASVIMNTGRNMGATDRDIMIALMTALQESSLRNLAGGDRDSVGLFQQRPSQGWGSVAQIRDPVYAATKFYEGLFKVKDREGLAPTVAAQKVQRSAFPNAYAKWQDEALAIMSATPMLAAASAQLTGAIGKGGRTVELLQQMMANSGLPYRITSTTGGQHAAASYHYKGQAVDIAGPRPGVDTPEMAAIAQYLSRNYGIGLAELIYGGPGGVSLKNGRSFNYSNSILSAHRNHVHAAATPESLKNLGIPGLKVGGEIRYDNTIANLHKNEKVLTAPLSAKLDEGLENMVNGGNTYQFTLDMRGATVRDDTINNIERTVRRVIDERENRNGRSRVVV